VLVFANGVDSDERKVSRVDRYDGRVDALEAVGLRR
jgi:hypothetical protein